MKTNLKLMNFPQALRALSRTVEVYLSVYIHSKTFKLAGLFSTLERLSVVRLIVCSTSLFKVSVLKIHERVFNILSDTADTASLSVKA